MRRFPAPWTVEATDVALSPFWFKTTHGIAQTSAEPCCSRAAKECTTRAIAGSRTSIVAHARLELALTELVYDLLRIDPKLGRQVLRGDNPSANYSILKRLFDLWGITPKVDFKKLKTDIEKACDKRNEVAHGVWVRMKGTDARLQLVREKRQTEVGLLDRRILPQFAKRGVGALRQDAKFINGITAKVRTLQKQVLAELEPWVKVVPHKLPKSSSAKRKVKRA